MVTPLIDANGDEVGNNPDAVDYMRRDLRDKIIDYELIDDCLSGERAIKEKSEFYLPKPGVFSQASQPVYAAYLKRAVFYGVAERTLHGMTGEVFAHDPIVEVPTSLNLLIDDVTGGGMPVTQLAKKAVGFVLSKGRAGLLSDYPQTDGPQTRAELADGEIRPVLVLYEAEAVINWHTFKRGSRELLDLVVLCENRVERYGTFGEKLRRAFRVLQLTPENIYRVDLWEESDEGVLHQVDAFIPTDANGNSFNEIPFTFIGSENNDPVIDRPPLYPLCKLNLAHYHNSADYEDSCFKLGQPTPWFSGLTEEWVKRMMNGVVTLGANGVISLPVGAQAGLLQAAPNTMIKEAMDAKERQMVALGARLVQQSDVQRTATESKMETASEMSVLASVAGNVSTAFRWGLQWSGVFLTGQDNLTIKFELNQKFDLAKASPDEVNATISAWQKGAIAFPEMRDVLRRAEMANLDDKDAEAAIAAESDARLQMAVQKADALGTPNPNDTVNSGA